MNNGQKKEIAIQYLKGCLYAEKCDAEVQKARENGWIDPIADKECGDCEDQNCIYNCEKLSLDIIEVIEIAIASLETK